MLACNRGAIFLLMQQIEKKLYGEKNLIYICTKSLALPVNASCVQLYLVN